MVARVNQNTSNPVVEHALTDCSEPARPPTGRKVVVSESSYLMVALTHHSTAARYRLSMLAFSIKQILRDMQLLATEKARRNAGGAAARCYPWWL